MLRFLKETCYQNRRHASPLSFSGSLRQRCSNANRSSSQSGVYNYKPSCLSNCLSVSLLSGGWGKTGKSGGAGDEWCHTIDIVQSPDYQLRKQWVRVKRRKVKVWQSVTWSAGSVVLLDDHAVGQVLGVVLEELSSGSRAVGKLQFLELLQLDEAWQTVGGQQGAAWSDTVGRHPWETCSPHRMFILPKGQNVQCICYKSQLANCCEIFFHLIVSKMLIYLNVLDVPDKLIDSSVNECSAHPKIWGISKILNNGSYYFNMNFSSLYIYWKITFVCIALWSCDTEFSLGYQLTI